MKNAIVFFCLALTLSACEQDATLTDPAAPRDLELELGNFSTEANSATFTPYERISELVFVDADGQEYTFRMRQRNRREGYRYSDIYPHPTESARRVNYLYTGDYNQYEFACAELGARLKVLLRPGLCGDPRLSTEDRVQDHLQVFGIGFNPLDFYNRTPTLDIEIPARSQCQDDSRKYGQLTLLDHTFTEVYYSRLFWQGRPLAFYYSPSQGIVAFETDYLLAVLDRSF
ncbi:MAG: hypothetical protein KDC54_09610 [Lewinella sp.]|nr:hypothetical protein [Lewinella sp.]